MYGEHSLCSATGPYLGLRHNGVRCRGSAEEGGQRRGDDDWIRPDKATEVTAGDGVLLSLHYQGVHGIEAVPRQPYCALLAHERGSLEVQSQGGTSIGNQVKPGEGSTGWIRRVDTASASLPKRLVGKWAILQLSRYVDLGKLPVPFEPVKFTRRSPSKWDLMTENEICT